MDCFGNDDKPCGNYTVVKEHLTIILAIQTRDEGAAVAALVRHIEKAWQRARGVG